MELSLLAMSAKTSTVLLECRNGQIRRYVVSSSVQASLPMLASVSAKFVLRKLALRDRAVRMPARMREVRKRICKTAPSQDTRRCGKSGRRGGGGGPWRAFVSERCRSIAAAAFKGLGNEYRRLPPEERARFAQRGALASMLHREGALSFGQVSRSLGRSMLQGLAHQRVVAMLEDSIDPIKRDIVIQDLQVSEIRQAAKKARTDQWLVRRIRRQQDDEAARLLVK